MYRYDRIHTEYLVTPANHRGLCLWISAKPTRLGGTREHAISRDLCHRVRASSFRLLHASHYGVMVGTKEVTSSTTVPKGTVKRTTRATARGQAVVLRVVEWCASQVDQRSLPGGARFLSFALMINASISNSTWRAEQHFDQQRPWKWKDHCHNCHFITASAQHIAVTGDGTIDGQGSNWWAHRDDFRPHTIQFSGVRTALIEGITIIDPTITHGDSCRLRRAFTCERSRATARALSYPSHNTDAVDVHGHPFYPRLPFRHW